MTKDWAETFRIPYQVVYEFEKPWADIFLNKIGLFWSTHALKYGATIGGEITLEITFEDKEEGRVSQNDHFFFNNHRNDNQDRVMVGQMINIYRKAGRGSLEKDQIW